jgi:hypothetical protein
MHAAFLQMCSLLFLQVAAILPYTTLSPIGFLRETGHVFCELRTESVHKMYSNFSLQSHLIL